MQGYATWCKVTINSNCDQRQFALVHLSLRKATTFMRQRFCNQGASWSSSCGRIKELCSQHPSQVGVLVTYLDLCIDWLVMYWESCIGRRDCHYITSPTGIPLLVTACFDNSEFLEVVTLNSLVGILPQWVFPFVNKSHMSN